MTRLPSGARRAATAAALGALLPSASAQNPAVSARLALPSTLAEGMGGAGAAFPTRETALFYNPAHLTRAAGLKPSVQLGASFMSTTSAARQYRFYRDDLSPALDRGLETLSSRELDTLYRRALDVGKDRVYSELAPAVTAVWRLGPVGVGAGAGMRTLVRYRAVRGGGGVPDVQAAVQTDLVATAAAALDLGRFGARGLSVGVTGKGMHRRVAAKDKPLDAFAADESFYEFSATGVGFDLGATYEIPVPLPGRLAVGLVGYDVIGSEMAYDYTGRRFDPACNPFTASSGDCARLFVGDPATDDPSVLASDRAVVERDFPVAPSYRVGVAYVAPSFFGLLRETGVALDYVGYSDALVPNRAALLGLHAGVQVQVLRRVAVRAGLNEGYPSGGLGLGLGPLRLDYAVHGQEDGRTAGQAPVWMHRLYLALAF